ncbi:ribosomal protein S18-alanine N-acetyltransferase [Bacillus aquiflavi]|uniref:[Ribosomal protein bS18]-alanine N-acetyltransferase n=1 Tax=Bacillus aquiflavi TaxID=2672567 RepID=A0A6B3W2J1_9BACI|nr:ribosomal protein S18-alanine N-acetyltransferase [Bacillus aquiflavi]MBA4538593.1 ribosomal protein S18-alanine N-acetyltransferase [Bacillus aquiflavi]NEY82955.1 ribosomal protein S18-alanine N-acetyltransferase [Bacillus aquiflavi]UAC48500.1 ribosomal protein S18-alanine N-acetyltransferase [Bacillus aquiflavi]
MSEMNFRYMTVDDIDKVLQIEQASFTLPWNREAFYHEMVHNQFAVYVLLEVDKHVVGYCGCWIIVDEAHITNVALLPEYRGKKLGEALMRQVMLIALQKGAKTMTLEVRVSNETAQNLYRKLGFQNGGVRKSYYTDNREDALVMWVNL